MNTNSENKNTFPVSNAIFQQVYDSPHSLPGKHKWITTDEDVRAIEKLLGMPHKSIGAPLWISGDEKYCPKCHREVNWLDIVSSAVEHVHGKAMIARVILGDKKFVNTENPRAIEKCTASTAIQKLITSVASSVTIGLMRNHNY